MDEISIGPAISASDTDTVIRASFGKTIGGGRTGPRIFSNHNFLIYFTDFIPPRRTVENGNIIFGSRPVPDYIRTKVPLIVDVGLIYQGENLHHPARAVQADPTGISSVSPDIVCRGS